MSSEVAIDEQVRELVEAHRPELEQLVDQALARELETLVAERITARNGGASEPLARTDGSRVDPPRNEPATKVCVGACGRTLPASAFEARRLKCRECRRAEARERDRRRAAEPEPDPDPEPLPPPTPPPPLPGITAGELAAHAARYGSAPADELERWLLDGRLAEARAHGLVPTALALELAGSIDLG